VLDDDGVSANDLAGSVPLVNIPELLKRFPTGQSFGWRVVQSPSNSATIISQLPGEGNRRHYHADWDEWWFILEGEYKFAIEDQTRTVKKGDLVFIERGKWHQITAAGKTRASRLAVSRDGVEHIYRD
jgi:quercetin dioxygenase-like cupin family protein